MKNFTYPVIVLSLISIIGCRSQSSNQKSMVQEVIVPEVMSSTPKAGKAFLYAVRENYVYQYDCGHLPVINGKSSQAEAREEVIRKGRICQTSFQSLLYMTMPDEQDRVQKVNHQKFVNSLNHEIYGKKTELDQKINELEVESQRLSLPVERKQLIEVQHDELVASNKRQLASISTEIKAAKIELKAVIKKIDPMNMQGAIDLMEVKDKPATNFHSYAAKGDEIAIGNALAHFPKAFLDAKKIDPELQRLMDRIDEL